MYMRSMLCFFLLFSFSRSSQAQDWPVYGGDPGGMKYSSLNQIDRSNVAELELAWTWSTDEAPIPEAARASANQPVGPGVFQATPIVVNDTMYLSTPYSRVVALDGNTGREIWNFDPRAYDFGNLARGCRFCHRGVAMWTDGSERRIFINTRWRLIALDAATGRPIESFGNGGEIDLTGDLPWPTNKLHYSNTSPPVIYDNLVIVGSGSPDNRIYRNNPRGDVQAFDVRTGERVWIFHTVPTAGEPETETWENESWSYTGSANVWTPFTVDTERGLIYLPVSTPNNDFYGGHRLGDNLFAESIVCLDANTGERVWHFQTIHHGLWDYDIPAPPNLITMDIDGETLDAVVVLGKTGFAYVFNRETGEPVWPIEEVPVPPSDVPGERASLTQPMPTKPKPFATQGLTEDDLIDFTPELRRMALEAVAPYRMGPMFTPASLDGTIMMPGLVGGGNWGGAAFDPVSQLLFVKSVNWPHLITVGPPDLGTADADYVRVGSTRISLPNGLPIHKPPYAQVTAIDMSTGEHRWQITFGDTPEIREHEALAGLSLPPLGVAPMSHGASAGPLATAGGLVFIGGGSQNLHAFNAEDGTQLWQGDLEGRFALGNPMTYQTSAQKQFVIVATSGRAGEHATLMAFALKSR